MVGDKFDVLANFPHGKIINVIVSQSYIHFIDSFFEIMGFVLTV